MTQPKNPPPRGASPELSLGTTRLEYGPAARLPLAPAELTLLWAPPAAGAPAPPLRPSAPRGLTPGQPEMGAASFAPPWVQPRAEAPSAHPRGDSWMQRANAPTVPPLRLRNDDWLLAHDPEFDGLPGRKSVQLRRSQAWLAGFAGLGFFLLGLVSTRFLLRDEDFAALASDTTSRAASVLGLAEPEPTAALSSFAQLRQHPRERAQDGAPHAGAAASLTNRTAPLPFEQEVAALLDAREYRRAFSAYETWRAAEAERSDFDRIGRLISQWAPRAAGIPMARD